MRYFSVPCDYSFNTLRLLYDLNQKSADACVHEVYGEITEPFDMCSGRMTDVLPPINRERFRDYVKYASEKGISFNYTLNPSCMGNQEFTKEGMDKIYDLLTFLDKVGVRRLTISSVSILEMVRKWLPGAEIKMSAISEINNPKKAFVYKKLDAKRIVVDPDVTRDFQMLKNICNVFGDGVEIIVNNVCLNNCIYKMSHYCHDAHSIKANRDILVKDFYINRCSMQKAKLAENVLKLNWIRPEDLVCYEECGINYFKVQGRQNVCNGDIIRTLKAYFERYFEGNLMDLLMLFAPYTAFQPYIDNKKLEGFIKPFFNDKDFCKDVCTSCGYCKKFIYTHFNMEELQRLNSDTMDFFEEYDCFGYHLDEVTKNGNIINNVRGQEDIL